MPDFGLLFGSKYRKKGNYAGFTRYPSYADAMAEKRVSEQLFPEMAFRVAPVKRIYKK